MALILTHPAAPGATVLTETSRTAIDALGNSVAPLISNVIIAGAPVYEFSTGTYTAGPFISTLTFNFTAAANEGNLLLHFMLMSGTADISGSGSGGSTDSLTVSLFDGTRSMVLLSEGVAGPTTDPFGTAPGPVTLGPPERFPLVYDYFLNADIHTLEGIPLQLSIDIANKDDGLVSTARVGTTLEIRDYPTPEPSSSLLLALTTLLLAFRHNRKIRQ